MSSNFSYKGYVSDEQFLAKYESYQDRYIQEPRESDKVLIQLVQKEIKKRKPQRKKYALLDIGCSTGNLLYHLKQRIPELELHGGDLAKSSIAKCRENSSLSGIRFEVMDLLDLGACQYDFIVANAVLCLIESKLFTRALESISKALKEGGAAFALDYCHPYNQEIEILERSQSHPKGLKLHIRSYQQVRTLLKNQGFADVVFHPFAIPIDLEKGETYSDNSDGFEDLNSYTIKTKTGERLIFRGSLYLPWCHIVAKKVSCLDIAPLPRDV